MRFIPAFLLFSWALSAQSISVGVRGGVPLSDALDTSGRFKSIPKRWTFGPAFEVRLPAGFGIGVDALYRRAAVEESGRETAGSRWDFPIMLRKRFGFGPIKPFIAGGLVFDRITGLVIEGPKEFVKKSHNGIVFGGGVEIKAAKIRLTPELRYSHRGSDSLIGAVGGLLRSNPNTFDFLVGLTF